MRRRSRTCARQPAERLRSEERPADDGMNRALLLLGTLAAAAGQGLHIGRYCARRLRRASDSDSRAERRPAVVSAGVVEIDPQAAWRLAAAAEAALPAEGADAADAATVEPVVPEEPLAVPAHVCGQATHATAALVGGGGTRLAAAAAARAGLPLLLVQPTPAPAAWEALALYPHEDVLVEVRRPRGEAAAAAPPAVAAAAGPCAGVRRSRAREGVAARRAAARGQRAPGGADRARRRAARAARPPAARRAGRRPPAQRAARAQEGGRDELHPVVRRRVRGERARRRSARRAARRAALVHRALARAAHAAAAGPQPRRGERHR